VKHGPTPDNLLVTLKVRREQLLTNKVYKVRTSLSGGALAAMDPLSEYGIRLLSSDGRYIRGGIGQLLGSMISWGVSQSSLSCAFETHLCAHVLPIFRNPLGYFLICGV
jgi:hypothetical protein